MATIAVILPAYNEELTIAETIQEGRHFFAKPEMDPSDFGSEKRRFIASCPKHGLWLSTIIQMMQLPQLPAIR